MERYEKYKESGIEWIGEIPEHWDVKKLKFIGKSIMGIIYSPSEVVSSPEQSILVLRASNIQEGKLSFLDNVYVDKKIEDNLKTKIGDILICSRSGSASLIGKNILIDEQSAGNTFGAFMTIFRTELFQFSYHFFNSQVFKGQTALFQTVTINQLTINVLNNFTVAIPLPEEQTAIANYLDRKTAEIDDLIAKKECLLELYNEEKTAIINQAVTKGLNPDTPMKDSGIEWLGDIPAHWDVKKLKYVANANPSNINKKSKDEEDEVFLCNYVDVYKNDFIGSEIEFMKATANNSQIEKFILKKGDVIATKDSETPDDIGNPALVIKDFENVVCGYHLTHIKPQKIKGEYLFRLLQSKILQAYFEVSANGITRYGLGVDKFNSSQILLPPTDEQIQIVSFIEKETVIIDAKVNKTKKLMELLKEYRTALISEAVTGKIKVSE